MTEHESAFEKRLGQLLARLTAAPLKADIEGIEATMRAAYAVNADAGMDSVNLALRMTKDFKTRPCVELRSGG